MSTQPRPFRAASIYEVQCVCGAITEADAASVDKLGLITCGACNKTSPVQWQEASGCKICGGPCLPGKPHCGTHREVYQAWKDGKFKQRAQIQQSRTARQADSLPAWSGVL
jgi:hypothetical protein